MSVALFYPLLSWQEFYTYTTLTLHLHYTYAERYTCSTELSHTYTYTHCALLTHPHVHSLRPPHTPTRTLTAPSSHTHTYTYCAPTRLAVAARLQDCQRAGRRPRCVLPARRAHHGVRAVASKVGSSVASRERVETRRATLLPTRYTTSYQVRAAAAVGPSRRPPCHVRHHAIHTYICIHMTM